MDVQRVLTCVAYDDVLEQVPKAPCSSRTRWHILVQRFLAAVAAAGRQAGPCAGDARRRTRTTSWPRLRCRPLARAPAAATIAVLWVLPRTRRGCFCSALLCSVWGVDMPLVTALPHTMLQAADARWRLGWGRHERRCCRDWASERFVCTSSRACAPAQQRGKGARPSWRGCAGSRAERRASEPAPRPDGP